MSGPLRTASVIAKLLGVEGYSDFVHNQIERYWRNKVMRRDAGSRIHRLDADFSEIMIELSDGEKLIVGKFISLRCQMSFNTGLRIGLTAHAHVNDKATFVAAEFPT